VVHAIRSGKAFLGRLATDLLSSDGPPAPGRDGLVMVVITDELMTAGGDVRGVYLLCLAGFSSTDCRW